MYKFTKSNLPKNTIVLNISIPWPDIAKEYGLAFETLRKDFETEGFRKGKVPKNIAEKKISKEEVYSLLLRSYVSKIYSEILKKEGIKPIIDPKIELKKANENEEWVMDITTAEAPMVNLNNYKEKVIKAKQELKKNDIWVPGKSKEPTKEEKEKRENDVFQAKLQAIMNEAKVEISDLILDEEVNKRRAKLVDDVQKIGLTMDSYLQSRGTTKDQLTQKMRKEAEDAYKIEFILQKIADTENISLTKEELDKFLLNIKDAKDKEVAQKNLYYYASIMRKQKTLDYINSL